MKHEWTKRPRKRVTDTAVIHRWMCKTDPHLVVDRITSVLGLSGRALLIRRMVSGNEMVISRHRKHTAAMRAADKLA